MQKELYDLTNPQKSIWFTEQFYKGTPIENITGSVIISNKINFDALKKAINIFISKNDSFRTKFIVENTTPKQYIENFEEFDFEVTDVKSDEDVAKISKVLATTPFEIINSYLFIFRLFKFADGHGGFIINAHHLIFDAWSAGVGTSEILDIYALLIKNEPVFEEKYPSYLEFISSEQEYLKNEKFEKDKEFWNKLYSSVPEMADIPSINTSTEISSESDRKLFSFPEKTIASINEFCKENKASIFNFFMGVLALYIGRVSNLDEFVIGTPILNRCNFKEKNTTGMFISTVPFKVSIKHDQLFGEFISEIGKQFLDIFRHQKYPYQYLLEDLRAKDNSIPNLYNILMSYQNARSNNQTSEIDYQTKWITNGHIADSIDIHLFDMNDTGNINIAYDYKTKKYSSEDISAMHERILHIINQILKSKTIALKDIEIVTPEEKNQILYEFNDTKVDYPKDKTIAQLFEEQVEKTPDNIAVVFEEQQLTYKELNEKANSLANYLRKNGIGRNDIVGIMVNRSLEMMIGILAVLKAGGAYLPIDPEYPEDRIKYMLENSEAKYILSLNKLSGKIKNNNILYINLNSEQIYSLGNKNLKNISKPEDLAYLIYTSGSTGLPKGVMLKNLSLSNLTNYCNNYVEYLKDNKPHVIVSITTISFDIFIFETLISLQRGLKLVIANEQEQNIPRLLNKLLNSQNIDILQTTPSRMQIFLNNLDDIPCLGKIKFITLAGEQVPVSLLNTLNSLSKAIVYNGYGPSETTVFSTYTNITNQKIITIGKPLNNTGIYILNNNKLCPIGVPGEICITGDGLGIGYINNKDLTNKSFVSNPFNKNELIYKTGDIGIYTKSGEIICLGRLDNQVKIRGIRIELEEIEKKILSINNIKNCIVIKKIHNNHEFLCAYFVKSGEINLDNVRKYLQKQLPNYMIPQYFMELIDFPYTPNGKVDRKKLPTPTLNISSEIILPRNDIDSEIIEILKNLLNIGNISIDNSFFELGGDSLTAINLSVKIHSKLNVEIFVKDILENPIIMDLSDLISNSSNSNQAVKINTVYKKEFYPTSSAQKRVYYSSLLDGNNSLLYNIAGGIILDKMPNIKKLSKCFNVLVNRHESLRASFDTVNNEIVQKINENINFKIEIDNNEIKETQIEKVFYSFVKPFDFKKAPLFNAKIVNLENKKALLLVNMHHIISDRNLFIYIN